MNRSVSCGRCRERRSGAVQRAFLLVSAFLVLSGTAWASPPSLEVNGRDYYGTVFTDNGEVYAAIDVVGPLLVGPQFHVEAFDVTLRRTTLTFVAAGATAPQKVEVFGCTKRGAAVYAPLKALVKALGGSYAAGTDSVRIAYPPVAASAPAAPSPAASPAPTQRVQATSSPTPLPQQLAMSEVQSANRGAFSPSGLIRKMEVYHPVSPDPSDAIPRTDLVGLKVYVRRLEQGDRVSVALWSSRQADGTPVFQKQLTGFRGQELSENSFFVRLPLDVAPGWHTVRIELNGRESVDYRFVTY